MSLNTHQPRSRKGLRSTDPNLIDMPPDRQCGSITLASDLILWTVVCMSCRPQVERMGWVADLASREFRTSGLAHDLGPPMVSSWYSHTVNKGMWREKFIRGYAPTQSDPTAGMHPAALSDLKPNAASA